MKVCTETHHASGFGEIPAGSLWADDSPFAQGDQFTPVEPDPAPVKPKKAPRKFGTKESHDDSGMD